MTSPPTQQDPLNPEQTDAALTYEIRNARLLPREPSGVPENTPRDQALALLQLGLSERAVKAYERSYTEHKNDLWYTHDYAVALTATCSEENVKKAVALLEHCVLQSPDQTWVYSSLAIAYGRSGQYEKAFIAYQKALELYTENADAKIIEKYRGKPDEVAGKLHDHGTRRFLLLGKPRESLRYQEAALALVGEESAPWAVFDKGKALFILGKYQEALVQLQRAAQLLPNQTWTQYELGVAYEAMGDVKSAKQSYEQALARSGENSQAREGLVRLSGMQPSL